MIKSCYGCTPETGRHIGCHGTCEKYIKEKAAYNAAREAEQKESYRANTNGTYYSGKNPRRGGHRKLNI